MAELELLIGNKNYSSWSLRPWLALKASGLPFREHLVPLYQDDSKAALLRFSPAGKAPALRDGALVIPESLAICEYVAELAPAAGLWPREREARAVARAVACEMHAGFVALRSTMPMNLRDRARTPIVPTPEAAADVARVQALVDGCRQRFGAGGPFLFGGFGIADAMLAPVATRFRTYRVALSSLTQAWCDAIFADPAFRAWETAAAAEVERLEATDRLLD